MRVGLLVGEKSADNLGAALMRDIKAQRDDVNFYGCGGGAMVAEGLDSCLHASALEHFGIVEVLRHLPKLIGYRRQMVRFFIERKIDVFVGIDLPDFNIGVEEQLRRLGILTVHYVSPTIWAWRRKRAQRFLAANDRILCLYPFEPEIYGSDKALFVGHPLADIIPMENPQDAALQSLQLQTWVGSRKVMALLPGSRMSEIQRLFLDFIRTAEICNKEVANICVVISAVNEEKKQAIERILKQENPAFDYRIITERNRDVIAAADQVLVASGTATLETLLVKRSMVIAYRTNALTAWIVRALTTTAFYSQPNWLAGREIVPEFMQERISPQNLAQACISQLKGQGGDIVDTFTAIHNRLRCNASQKSAQAICALYENRRSAYMNRSWV